MLPLLCNNLMSLSMYIVIILSFFSSENEGVRLNDTMGHIGKKKKNRSKCSNDDVIRRPTREELPPESRPFPRLGLPFRKKIRLTINTEMNIAVHSDIFA